MYCDEKGCDCRRVLFCVCSETTGKPLAYIGWGWESVDFYREWMRFDPDADEIAQELKGPVLNWGSPQSEYAGELLDLCEMVLLKDPQYIERIKRHYKMFRDKIDHPYRIDSDHLKEDLAEFKNTIGKMKEVLARMPKKESARHKRMTEVMIKKEALLKKKAASLKKKNRNSPK